MAYLEVEGMKRRRKKIMLIIPAAVICVAGAGTVGYFKVAHTKPVQNVTAQAQSAEAKKGNLSKTIVGTGNLELAEAEDQDAPSGLEISEVMVESGDEVKEGDVLAVVDESSILEAMEQVQDKISQLDESIQEYQDSDEENVIESSVSGRVKKINVSAGSDLSDIMVSDGALMVLSLDGKMAVSLSGVSGVSAGDSVTVTLSSGTQVTGTVDSASGEDCVVTLTAGDGYVFQAGSVSGITLGTVSGICVSQDGKSMSFQITFPETAAETEDIKKDDSGDGKTSDSTDNGKNADDNKDNDADQITDRAAGQTGNNSGQNGTGSTSSNGKDSSDNGTNSTSETNGNSTQSGNDQSGNGAGTSANNISGSSSGASQTEDTQETDSSASTSGTELSTSEYSTDVALFTISPDDTMTLEVSVDELDINSVEIGQEAAVTFDAIEDKEFTGEVTEIGNTASVNGGVAKYTVSVSVPKDEEMKQGMNASATITIENRENVITIPVNALQEKGNKVFVYTEKDEDGNLSGETEVTTGLSDGTTVEITEGLSEGDTVYYNKSGNTDSGSGNDSGMPDGMGDFGDMSGGPGGNSDSGNSGGPGRNGGGPGGSGSSGGNGGGTPPNM